MIILNVLNYIKNKIASLIYGDYYNNVNNVNNVNNNGITHYKNKIIFDDNIITEYYNPIYNNNIDYKK
jgi:hypothetical protein